MAAAVVGTAAVSTKAATDPRTVGTQVDDGTLELRVNSALSKDQQIKKEARINVTAYQGKVLLAGQAPNTELASRADLVVAPNLWAGVGLVRGGAGTALVGNPRQVADRLLEYRDLGIDSFILSGYPHLEEAHRVADLLFPLLPVTAPPPAAQPAPDVAFVSPFGDLQPARSAS